MYDDTRLNEIHRSYSVQLEESGRTVSNLQQVVRALEQSRDGFHSRTFIAERDAQKYKAERDALLALVRRAASIAPTTVCLIAPFYCETCFIYCAGEQIPLHQWTSSAQQQPCGDLNRLQVLS